MKNNNTKTNRHTEKTENPNSHTEHSIFTYIIIITGKIFANM